MALSQKEPRTARGHCVDTYIKKWSIEALLGGPPQPDFGVSGDSWEYGEIRHIVPRGPTFDPLCASQIIFGKIPPLEMLFRFDGSSCSLIQYFVPILT